MKKWLLVLTLLFSMCAVSAQTVEEWTQQKKTRIKRLREQIVANKVYIEYAEKGYQILTDGLHTIRDIKNGDFKLHTEHFESLKAVNPKIKAWVKVADIMAGQVRILKSSKQAITTVRESGRFTQDELDYCKQVFDRLLAECVKNLDGLVLVSTTGELEMTDDERMARIERAYLDMQEKASFTASFTSDMRVLALQRLTEQVELHESKTINGLR